MDVMPGMRIGEAYALTWKDIDFKNNTINIDKTMERIKVDGKYQWLIDTPKRPKSIRVIPLANRAKEQLLWLKTVSPGLKASVTENNIPPSQSTLTSNLMASAYMIYAAAERMGTEPTCRYQGNIRDTWT